MELQCIPAKTGTATYLPAGRSIKIINTSGTQVVDTWAFALPKPEPKKGDKATEAEEQEVQQQPLQASQKRSKRSSDLPSQEDAEKATREGLAQGGKSVENHPKKGTWTGYLPSVPSVPSVPSLGFGKSKVDADAAANKKEQLKNSKTWSSYFAAGKGFSSYIPQQASDTVTQFAGYHARDNNRTYLQQLQDFSRTPVGAAGMAAISGGGYGSSLYAGYSAWNSKHAADVQPMEFLSMEHSRTSTLHLAPQLQDTLVTNLREPILTLVEDTSPGTHDTLIAACDPNRYRQLGAPDWEQHGSCAENLVLALKELNERAGLKGAKGVGAQVSVNTVPAPLNLFMNVPWENNGDLGFGKAKSRPGDYVRFFAERDVVVVMSACPQDLTDINSKEIQDAHFIVEDFEKPTQAPERTQPRKKSLPRKISSSQTPTTTGDAENKSIAEPDLAKWKPTVNFQKPSAAHASKPANSASSQPSTKKSQQSSSQKPAQTATQSASGSRPKKKPIPPSADAETNGEAAVPGERKKPRKLLVRSQAATGT